MSATADTHGTVALAAGTITYTPAANYNGPASFQYTLSDGQGGSDTGLVSLTVTPVNDAPLAVDDDAGSTAEDTPKQISAASLLANDSDADGNTLSVSAVSATANTHGTVSLAAGTITYTPAANYNGPASFKYTLSDGQGGSDTGLVSLTVTPVNDAPVAVDDQASVAEDSSGNAIAVLANDSPGSEPGWQALDAGRDHASARARHRRGRHGRERAARSSTRRRPTSSGKTPCATRSATTAAPRPAPRRS